MSPRALPGRPPSAWWTSHHIKEGPRYVRAWFTRWHSRDGDEVEIGSISFEGFAWRRDLGLYLSFSMEDEWSAKIHVGLGPLAQVWIGASRWPSVRWLATKLLPIHGNGYTFRDGREWRVSLDNNLLVWNFWNSDPLRGTPPGPVPKHREGMVNLHTWFFGRPVVTDRLLDAGEIPIHLPEKTYIGRYEMNERTHRWPRFKRPRTVNTGQIDVEGGIYVPGKCEAGYDCGDDALFSLSGPGSDPAELVGQFAHAVLKQRLKHNGTIDLPKQP